MSHVVFLCVANASRSQMAEGLARASAPPGWKVYSAGSRPGTLSSNAVEVMREIGIDISTHRAKGLDEVPLAEADVVITLCAEEECPVAYTKGKRLAWPHPDPGAPGDGDALERFRSVRDQLKQRIETFWATEGAAR